MLSRRLIHLLPGIVRLTPGVGGTALAVKHHIVVGVQDDGDILIPNDQTLTPAGTHIEVSDRPLGILLPGLSLASRPCVYLQ